MTQENLSDNLQPQVSYDRMEGIIKSKAQICKMGKKRNATLRKDGRWQAYADIDGKRKACYGSTEYKACYKADIAEAKARGDEETLKKMTSDEKDLFKNCFFRYRNYLLFHTNLQRETIDRYEVTYNKYFKGSALEETDIMKVDSDVVSSFLMKIFKKYDRLSDREYGRISHIIKAVIDFMIDEELTKADREEVQLIEWDRIRRKAAQQGKIFKQVKKQYAVSMPEKQILQKKIVDERIYPAKFASTMMLLINFGLGLRIGELVALKVGDIDMEHGVVYVQRSSKSYKKRDEFGNPTGGYIHTEGKPKTEKGNRMIPMSYTVQKLFEELFKYRKQKGYRSPYLVYDGETLACPEKSMGRTLHQLCKKAEVDDFTSHIIRKSFATALSCCPDIDVATISEYLGHAQVSTTMNNYLIPARDSLQSKRDKMSKVL